MKLFVDVKEPVIPAQWLVGYAPVCTVFLPGVGLWPALAKAEETTLGSSVNED